MQIASGRKKKTVVNKNICKNRHDDRKLDLRDFRNR